ncbi:hypothetical protein Droror1_Dr00023499 [Drosera rotundifolia]
MTTMHQAPKIVQVGLTGERKVKRLRLSKALTVPETTSVYEACCRMATRRVDALLLTDSNALVCGILTDKDIATRVIALGNKSGGDSCLESYDQKSCFCSVRHTSGRSLA